MSNIIELVVQIIVVLGLIWVLGTWLLGYFKNNSKKVEEKPNNTI